MNVRSKMIFAALAFAAAGSAAAESWQPPVGIPAPAFGIEQSHLMYSGKPDYHIGEHGPYSIYVDNTAENCSNRGPATAARPLCEIPLDIGKPGTIVEIHGGPYDYELSKPVMDANGTSDRPVFIRGADDGAGLPIIANASTFAVQGQYVVVENLIFEGSSLRTGTAQSQPKYGRNHIAFRDLEIRNHPSKNGSALIGKDIVFYRNHVHHNQGDDRHGTTVARGSERVWIIENHFHHNGGDAVQFCHRCRKDPPRKIYVGRNLMHSDRENGVDLKFGKDIVISENTIHSYRAARRGENWCFDDDSYCGTFSSGSDGSAIVVGSDGAPGRPWIIANNIFDSSQGIRIEEVREAWILGNRIHNIDHNAIALQKWGETLHIAGNVMSDAEYGINQYWRDKFTLHVSGNVLTDMRESFVMVKGVVASRSTINDNVFWNGDERISFRWGRRYKEKPAPESRDLEIAGSRNFIADPGIEKTADRSIGVRIGSETEAARQSQVESFEQRFREIYGDEASISGAASRPLPGPCAAAQ